MLYVFGLWCALMNRMRGSQFWNLLPSTTLGRILAMLGIATATVALTGNIYMFGVWPLLYGWTVLAWDAYWSAEIGHDKAHGKLWGFGMMAWRMSLLSPAILYAAYIAGGNYWWALATPLLALPYFILGSLARRMPALKDPIPASEYAVGALLGFIIERACGL